MKAYVTMVAMVVVLGCGAQSTVDGGVGGGTAMGGGTATGGGGGSTGDVFAGAWNLSGTMNITAAQTTVTLAGPANVVRASDGNYRIELSTCALVYLPDANSAPPSLSAFAGTSCTFPGTATITANGQTGPLGQNIAISLTTGKVIFAADVLSLTGSGTGSAGSGVYDMTFNLTGRR